MDSNPRSPKKVVVKDKRRHATEGAAPDAVPEVVEGIVVENPVTEDDVERDLLDDLRRLQAEFENYRKRMMKEQSGIAERASARVIESLLPVLDDFERALEHAERNEGIELIHRHLRDALTRAGLQEIESEGRPFDPALHEAVDSVEDSEVSEPTCKTVYRRGYRVGDRLLRPAMVVVARPAEAGAPRDSIAEA